MAEVQRGVVGDEEYAVGQALDNGSVITRIDIETYDDGSQRQHMEATHASGAVDRTTTFAPAPDHPLAVQTALVQKLHDALIDNVTVLGELGEDSHLAALTRQVNALIYLVLGQFDSTAGT